MRRRLFRKVILTCIFLGLLLSSLGIAATFLEQRQQFREEIKYKQETKLDQKGLYAAVIFDKDQGKYKFPLQPEDKTRLKEYMSSYFGCEDQAMLEKMAGLAATGHFLIYKEYQEDGVNLKVVFLSPQARYWEWLTDANGIEKMFHVYNFSVGLYPPEAKDMYVMLQTEGEFFGISRAVTLPVWFGKDEANRMFHFHMPTEAEITKAVQELPPLKPGRTGLEEKFIDYCRAHPYFQQQDDKGNYVIPDQEIKEMLHRVILGMEEGCEVKETTGRWHIVEDFPGYMLVSYSLKTRVNIEALIPPFLRFAAGTLAKAAQMISDEVSVKYLPLSMKNFRDFTQEWTKHGPPQ